MDIKDFDYKLPKELIAQIPASPRDHSRLLVLNRKNNKIHHDYFYNLLNYLEPNDLLVLNNSKVFPARLIGQKEITNGEVEILLNHEVEPGAWQCIGKNLKAGLKIKFSQSKLKAIVLGKEDDIYNIRFNISGENFFSELEKIGLTPLPPYIKTTEELKNRRTEEQDRKHYQTVYAKERGSAAAPTAGLHLTSELMTKIKKRGIKIEYVTLHVGLGTFAPVKSDKIEKHKIHKEFFSIKENALKNIIKAKAEHRRIIAVGTTTVRTLETMFEKLQIPNYKFQTNSKIQSLYLPNEANLANKADSCYSGWTDIFIYPGYKFKCVDGLITNFHLPKSTLLMLVSAFAGKQNIDRVYSEAIKQKYRFYSYGDAMLII